MRLIGYTRVSTEEQVRNGQGLDIQADQIKAWASAQGHEIIAWHSDAGISGTIEDRPGLVSVLDGLGRDEGGADGVVAQADTRYARTLTAQEGFYAACWKRGAHIFTVQAGEVLEDDPDDPMRKAIRQMRGVMAELEAGLIRKRLRDGIAHAKANGQHTSGMAPFGWEIHDKFLIPRRDEQIVLREVKRMRFEENLNLYKITAALNAQGIKGRRGGTTWRIAHVKRLLPPGVHPSERDLHPNWLQPDKNGPADGMAAGASQQPEKNGEVHAQG